MAFLRYRREVVMAWPESPRKTVFLNAIEGRISNVQHQSRVAYSVGMHQEPETSPGQNSQIGT